MSDTYTAWCDNTPRPPAPPTFSVGDRVVCGEWPWGAKPRGTVVSVRRRAGLGNGEHEYVTVTWDEPHPRVARCGFARQCEVLGEWCSPDKRASQ